MNEGSSQQKIQAIGKNVYIPIAFVGGIVAIAIFAGMVNANVQQNEKEILRLDASLVPRLELNGRLGNIESDIREVKMDVKELLRRK